MFSLLANFPKIKDSKKRTSLETFDLRPIKERLLPFLIVPTNQRRCSSRYLSTTKRVTLTLKKIWLAVSSIMNQLGSVIVLEANFILVISQYMSTLSYSASSKILNSRGKNVGARLSLCLTNSIFLKSSDQ